VSAKKTPPPGRKEGRKKEGEEERKKEGKKERKKEREKKRRKNVFIDPWSPLPSPCLARFGPL